MANFHWASTRAIFLTAFAHFLCLCVTFWWFLHYFKMFITFIIVTWPIISDLWCYYCQKITTYWGLRWQFASFSNRVFFFFFWGMYVVTSFPSGSDSKESAWNAGDLGSFPGSGRSPGEVNGNTLQYSCLENSMDRGAWWATVHGVTKSRTGLRDFNLLRLLHCFLDTMLLHT